MYTYAVFNGEGELEEILQSAGFVNLDEVKIEFSAAHPDAETADFIAHLIDDHGLVGLTWNATTFYGEGE